MKKTLLSLFIILCAFSNFSSLLAQSAGCVTGNATASNISYKIDGVSVTTLNGQALSGKIVQVTFTTASGTQSSNFSLISYKAPSAVYADATATQQTVYDSETKNFIGGVHTLSVSVPSCYYQVAFVRGCVIPQLGPAGTSNFYASQNRLLASASGGTVSCSGTPAPTAPCVKSNQNFDFSYTSVTNTNNTVTLKFDVTVNSNQDLTTVAFELPANNTASAYSPNSGVENPAAAPFYSIKWNVVPGTKNGATKSFTYTISKNAFTNLTSIIAYAKTASTTGQVLFNKNGCSTVTPPPCTVVAAIAGPDTVCAFQDSSNYVFTTPAQTGATYNWSVPADWVIKSGAGTNSLVIAEANSSGNVSVTVTNTCGIATNILFVFADETCGTIVPLSTSAETASGNNLQSALTLYPNPVTNGSFKISFTKTLENAVLTISDLNGRTLYLSNLKNNASELTLQSKEIGLKTGLYLVTIRDSKNIFTKKLLIN